MPTLAFAACFLSRNIYAKTDWCARCHSNSAPFTGSSNERKSPPSGAPLLPEHFSMQWDMHEFSSPTRPPVADLKKQKLTIKGTTHFDSGVPAMTEIYKKQCIDIFDSGRDFPCQFLSVGSVTWFIKFSKDGKSRPESCCKWSPGPFWSPRRDVVHNMINDSQGQKLRGKNVSWWVLDIPLPGPFGYGFYTNGQPAAFWFPVNSGWVQQEFRDFNGERPASTLFGKPEICRDESPAC